jgi:hypothetical protein
MFLTLIGVALATHVPTFAIDPLYTKAPFAGFEALVVEPSVAIPQMKQVAAPGPRLERVANGAEAGANAVVFTNPANNWAELSLGGVKVGNIGPYATVRMEGVPRGSYELSLAFTTGYVRSFLVTD